MRVNTSTSPSISTSVVLCIMSVFFSLLAAVSLFYGAWLFDTGVWISKAEVFLAPAAFIILAIILIGISYLFKE